MSIESMRFKCPCCEGAGVVPLRTINPALIGTLELLGRVVTPVSTQVLFAVPDVSNRYMSISGLCNRLAKLEALGLVKSERRGKAKYWEVVK